MSVVNPPHLSKAILCLNSLPNCLPGSGRRGRQSLPPRPPSGSGSGRMSKKFTSFDESDRKEEKIVCLDFNL
jgi:hypothetical protein